MEVALNPFAMIMGPEPIGDVDVRTQNQYHNGLMQQNYGGHHPFQQNLINSDVDQERIARQFLQNHKKGVQEQKQLDEQMDQVQDEIYALEARQSDPQPHFKNNQHVLINENQLQHHILDN